MDIRNDNFSVSREVQHYFKLSLMDELSRTFLVPSSVKFYGDDMVVEIGLNTEYKFTRVYRDFTQEIISGTSAISVASLLKGLYQKFVLRKFLVDSKENI